MKLTCVDTKYPALLRIGDIVELVAEDKEGLMIIATYLVLGVSQHDANVHKVFVLQTMQPHIKPHSVEWVQFRNDKVGHLTDYYFRIVASLSPQPEQ